jgi:tRNA-2-methylthio-N6-dimethylallyladenosine synthase
VKAFVTIMEGCDNFCTFCIVPFTRGRERCRPIGDVVREVEALARAGYREVQLLGQNVNSYRDPADGRSFEELIDAVHAVEGIWRIRFTSPHPKDFGAPLMRRFRELEKLCPHMHLPVQSGSTSVLKRMNRGYSRDEFLAKVELARTYVPDLALTTDVIVGFPGETDVEFEDTISLFQEVGFDGAYSFKYSERPYTYASRRQPDDVPGPVKAERLTRLQDVQKRIQIRKNAEFLGRTVEVLVEGESKKRSSELSGKSADNRTVNFPGERGTMGTRVQVRVTRSGPNSLFGELEAKNH